MSDICFGSQNLLAQLQFVQNGQGFEDPKNRAIQAFDQNLFGNQLQLLQDIQTKGFDDKDVQAELACNQIEMQRREIMIKAFDAAQNNPDLCAQYQKMDKELLQKGVMIDSLNRYDGNMQSAESMADLAGYESDLEFAMQMIQQKRAVLEFQMQNNPSLVSMDQPLINKLDQEMSKFQMEYQVASENFEKFDAYYEKTGMNADNSIDSFVNQDLQLEQANDPNKNNQSGNILNMFMQLFSLLS